MSAEAMLSDLSQWCGSEQTTDGAIAPFSADALMAVLGRTESVADGMALPLPWHWLYLLVPPAAGATGVDGHPARGGFLPPVPLPRRMWAASDIRWYAPLRIGAEARRQSRVASVEAKNGRSGPLVFVTVEHEYSQAGRLAIEERQTIVYRDAARDAPRSPVQAASGIIDPATMLAQIVPDAVMLFRYSALTYNSHRIHYDLPYARQEEGYPDLVVHGPLVATLLLDAGRPLIGDRKIARFSFRAESPAFVDRPLSLCGREHPDHVELWSAGPDAVVGMRARIELSTEAQP